MQEDRGICLLLKEMFTKLKIQRRRGKGVKPLGGDVWGARWRAGRLKIVFVHPVRGTVLIMLSV